MSELTEAVEALHDILDIECRGVQIAGPSAAEVMQQIARAALHRLGQPLIS